ncbi:alpha/beta hydrolase [Flavobacterium cellulosilyticum]|uniref:Alpha/beta hydrolase n=2 Tax=Flavobacterium cellulosilyticum TaxID=2541731 RepID=A0A4R5CFP2_9FLAO|nr:alpha/beta hydrolase [Flavobacterium cellulosilyticum]
MKDSLYFLFTKTIGLYLNLMSFVLPEKAIQLSHAFFSEPRKGKFTKAKLPKILREAHSESIQYKGESIQTYIWKGNETVILLVHGWESNSSRWKKMMPYLKQSGSTIIAFDGPAQGLSSGKEFSVLKIAEYIDVVAKKFQPHYLIGHSLGGKSSLYYQYKYQNPEIQKMVILGAPSDFKIILNNFISLLSLNSKIKKALEDQYISVLNHTLDQFTSKEFASKITTKGLLAHDIDDTIVLFEEGKKIASAWKNVQFIETSGLGHSLHNEELYTKVAQFLFEKE